MKSRRRKRTNPKKKIIVVTIILLLLWIGAFYIYTTYKNIKIEPTKYETTRLSSTQNEQTVENEEENSKKIADIIEETTKNIVGISKLKNTGNSILSTSNEAELGLGTGVIVTENGYILSNEHVTGSKYSKCYITLEMGKTMKEQ